MRPRFDSYKPNKDPVKGSAVQFEYVHEFTRDDEVQSVRRIMLEASKQQGAKLAPGAKGKQFDWENKVRIALNPLEMGRMMAVIAGRIKEAEIYHKTEKATSQLSFVRQKGGDYDNYKLRIRSKNADEKEARTVQIYLDHDEIAVLNAFLLASIQKATGF